MKKIFSKLILSSVLMGTVFSSPFLASAEENDGTYLLNHDADGTLKEGFVEENPWENNFKGITLKQSKTNGEIIDYTPYSETQAEQVFEDLEETEKMAPEASEALINDNILAVNSLIIEPAALKSKTWYRTEFKALALYAGTISLPTAGNYLNHSLQDDPSNRLNNVGSGHANALSLTKMYTTISKGMANEIDAAHKAGKKSVGGQGSIATSIGNVGMDFYLTYGKVSYSWAAVKETKKEWFVNISIIDVYDYGKIKKVSTGFPQKYIDLANNHAADAQKAGAIVKYNITNMFNQTYNP